MSPCSPKGRVVSPEENLNLKSLRDDTLLPQICSLALALYATSYSIHIVLQITFE